MKKRRVFTFDLIGDIVGIMWPVLVAVLGALIMHWAGNGNCTFCNIFQFLAYGMNWWGWIGAVLVASGLIFVLWMIFTAWRNVARGNKKTKDIKKGLGL